MSSWEYDEASCWIDKKGTDKMCKGTIQVDGGTGMGGDGENFFRVCLSVLNKDSGEECVALYLTFDQLNELKDALEIAYAGAEDQELDTPEDESVLIPAPKMDDTEDIADPLETLAQIHVQKDQANKVRQDLNKFVAEKNHETFLKLEELFRKAVYGTWIRMHYMDQDAVIEAEFLDYGDYWTLKIDDAFHTFIEFDDISVEGDTLLLLRKGTEYRFDLIGYLGGIEHLDGTQSTRLVPCRIQDTGTYPEDKVPNSGRVCRYKNIPAKCYTCARWRWNMPDRGCEYAYRCMDHKDYFYKERGQAPLRESTDLDENGAAIAYGGGFEIIVEKDTGVVELSAGEGEYGLALLPKAENQIMDVIKKAKEIRAQKEAKE